MFCWHLSQTQSLSSRIRPIADSWYKIIHDMTIKKTAVRCTILRALTHKRCSVLTRTGSHCVFITRAWRATPETRWLAAGRDYWPWLAQHWNNATRPFCATEKKVGVKRFFDTTKLPRSLETDPVVYRFKKRFKKSLIKWIFLLRNICIQ